jgi:hypothetical protein
MNLNLTLIEYIDIILISEQVRTTGLSRMGNWNSKTFEELKPAERDKTFEELTPAERDKFFRACQILYGTRVDEIHDESLGSEKMPLVSPTLIMLVTSHSHLMIS